VGFAALAGTAGLPQEVGRPSLHRHRRRSSEEPLLGRSLASRSLRPAPSLYGSVAGRKYRAPNRPHSGSSPAPASLSRRPAGAIRAGRAAPGCLRRASAATRSSRMGNRRTIRSSLAAPSATPRRRLEQLSPRGWAPSLTFRCSRAGGTGPCVWDWSRRRATGCLRRASAAPRSSRMGNRRAIRSSRATPSAPPRRRLWLYGDSNPTLPLLIAFLRRPRCSVGAVAPIGPAAPNRGEAPRKSMAEPSPQSAQQTSGGDSPHRARGGAP